MKQVPDYAELFTVEEFVAIVQSGAINEYDGTGYWVTEEGMTDAFVDFEKPSRPTGATHVAWFNK